MISALSLLLPLAVGVLVCVGSALLPAVRAGRTAPLAALRETAVDRSGGSGTRALAGTVLALAGLGAILAGVFATPSVLLAGAGAVLAVLAFVVLGPVASSLAVRILGASWSGCAVSRAGRPGATRCVTPGAPRRPPPR